MSFDTPILIIAWRRPDKVYKLLKLLSCIKPKKIYVSCDGPRENFNNEFKKVMETRKVIEKEINWEYEVLEKRFISFNQGCKEGVSNAINWFFENEEEGIILEDDILPHEDFFVFCENMLNKFRLDERVWSVTGCNFQKGNIRGKNSYYFSKHCHCWGWATWKRCWKEYDKDIKLWPKLKKQKILNSIFKHDYQAKYWSKIFDDFYYHQKPDTWDYPWSFCCFINGGLTVTPNFNLIENVGFDNDATHTKIALPNLNLKLIRGKSTKVMEIEDLNHPFFVSNEEADTFMERNHLLLYKKNILEISVSYMKKILKKFLFFFNYR